MVWQLTRFNINRISWDSPAARCCTGHSSWRARRDSGLCPACYSQLQPQNKTIYITKNFGKRIARTCSNLNNEGQEDYACRWPPTLLAPVSDVRGLAFAGTRVYIQFAAIFTFFAVARSCVKKTMIVNWFILKNSLDFNYVLHKYVYTYDRRARTWRGTCPVWRWRTGHSRRMRYFRPCCYTDQCPFHSHRTHDTPLTKA